MKEVLRRQDGLYDQVKLKSIKNVDETSVLQFCWLNKKSVIMCNRWKMNKYFFSFPAIAAAT